MEEFKAKELEALVDLLSFRIPREEPKQLELKDNLKRFRIFHVVVIPLILILVEITQSMHLLLYVILNCIMYVTYKMALVIPENNVKPQILCLFILVIDLFFFWYMGLIYTLVRLVWSWVVLVVVHCVFRRPLSLPTNNTETVD